MKTHGLLLAFSFALLTTTFLPGQEVAFPTPAPQEVASQRNAWQSATVQERRKIAEVLGEEGARKFAARNGYQKVLDQGDRALRQGFDQVYRTKDGSVAVLEAKGGASALGHAYGCQQGTAEWAVKAAKRILESARATAAEREAARLVLEAAHDSKPIVQVIRTEHALGQATKIVLESLSRGTAAEAKAAAQILEGLATTARGVTAAGSATRAVNPTTKAAFSTTQAAEAASTVTRGTGTLAKVGKAAGPAAVVVDGGVRVWDAVETEKKYQAGEISQAERVTAHAKNAAGMAGGWAGAWGGAKGGAAAGGAIGAFFGGVGAPVGVAIGGGVGAVGGYFGGDYLGNRIVDGVRWLWE